jgi:hypothetical protein
VKLPTVSTLSTLCDQTPTGFAEDPNVETSRYPGGRGKPERPWLLQ